MRSLRSGFRLLGRKASSLRFHSRVLLGLGALPNAIIIGAMKGGTTSLFEYLIQHPDVSGSRTKELHFFDNQSHKGERWYRANFRPNAQPIILESSPYYFFHPLAPQRAASLVPGARLIALLRNPADRAYSHYNQNVEQGLESLSFVDALDMEQARLAGREEDLIAGRVSYSHEHQTFSYVAKGLYALQIRRWTGHFPRSQLLILKAEDLFSAPRETMNRVTDFLDIPRRGDWDFRPRHQRHYPPLDPAIRRRLDGVFEEPNRELAALTGISWNKGR